MYQDTTDPHTEFKSLLKKAGFFVRHCESPEFCYKFSNKNQLMAAVKAVNPFLTRVPAESQTEFLTECVTTLMSVDQSAGNIEARYKLIVAHMIK